MRARRKCPVTAPRWTVLPLIFEGSPPPSDVERYVDAAALTDSRIYFVLEPILGKLFVALRRK